MELNETCFRSAVYRLYVQRVNANDRTIFDAFAADIALTNAYAMCALLNTYNHTHRCCSQIGFAQTLFSVALLDSNRASKVDKEIVRMYVYSRK